MKKLLFLLAAFSTFGCFSSTDVYREAHDIPNEEWQINHPQKFGVEIDKSGIYDVNIDIRHTSEYEFANLWCFVTIQEDSTLQTILRDTLNISVAAEDGRWLGEGNLFINVSKNLRKKVVLSSGKYIFNIEQGMRVDKLNGIKNVGISICPVNSTKQ